MPHNETARTLPPPREPGKPSPAAAAAVHYATARGFCCYPQKPGTRVAYFPFKVSGRKWGATSNPTLLARMFAARPDAEVCIVTGELSGIIVLDVDLPEEGKKRRDGRETLARLIAEHGPLPPTLMARTPKGGTHYFFRWPGFYVKNSVGELGRDHPDWSSGLDFRGDGGMVVAAPSKGRVWVDPDHGIAEASPWMIDWLRADALPLLHQRRARVEAPRPANTRRNKQLERPPAPKAADDEIIRLMTRYAGKGFESVTDVDSERLKIRMALRVIPPESVDYERWYKIGAAIFNVLGPLGFDLFDAWSSRDKTVCRSSRGGMGQPRYTKAGCEFKWAEIAACPPVSGRHAGVGFLCELANEFSATWRERYDELEWGIGR